MDFFNKGVQKMEETFKTAERTMLDPSLENLKKQCDLRYRWASSFVALAENVIQPNPASRMEDMILKGLDREKTRTTDDEQFGESLAYVGKELGSSSAYGASLIKFGEAQSAIGASSKELQKSVKLSYIDPMRKYIDQTCEAARHEWAELESARLLLDRAKTQLRRTNDSAKKQSTASYTQAEQSVTEKQALFDRQCETAKRAMENCLSQFEMQETHVKSFLNCEREFYQKCLDSINEAL